MGEGRHGPVVVRPVSFWLVECLEVDDEHQPVLRLPV
jgi:hypothetical protein